MAFSQQVLHRRAPGTSRRTYDQNFHFRAPFCGNRVSGRF
jgi:hypothetical protein